MQQLVENYVDHDLWFRGKVAQGLAQLDRGEFLTHDQVQDQLNKLLKP